MFKELKMLTGSCRSGRGGFPILRHGLNTLPAYGEGLSYRVISAEQGKPVSFPARGRKPQGGQR